MSSFEQGDRVKHQNYGTGTVVSDMKTTVVVRFEHGIEECLKADLVLVPSIVTRIEIEKWDIPLELINRLQAETIMSTNSSWGVFARSRIELLPHQLWVCRQVNQEWPTRWLVADDVGLGKTIEAGIILTPILASGKVRRLMVICPAKLVPQWQERLRIMFDIRLTQFRPEADTDRTDFWGTNNRVAVSLQTLREDKNERHRRLLESDPWDLVIVDESHHLNSDEKSGPTLGYQLVKKMQENGLINSMLFFTGTPHRGKDYGFIGQLQLLRPDLFDTKYTLAQQIAGLRQVMIRNNKYNVTDLKGKRLFREPDVKTRTYSYSNEEQLFYDKLSDFILTGKAYASKLSQSDGRTVMLVLIAMQKLASSSVAAIRRAIRNRLLRIQEGRREVEKLEKLRNRYLEMKETDLANEEAIGDELTAIEEMIVEESTQIRLMQDEEESLGQLIKAADLVRDETKITEILKMVENEFRSRSILFFTEYKATQSLLMSALIAKFGEECVTFINGDDKAEGVVGYGGTVKTLHKRREEAADLFNRGKARFLVSTEAGGEGIDLQESCHTLIHVDLPWNPMRMHQRVGRLNRYGQTNRVEVINLRNPDTVESRIWSLLDEKIRRITVAFSEVMDDPEDLLQLVLGMTSSGVFDRLFTDAPRVSDEKLSEWFDKNTGTFGGKDAVDTVKAIVGEVSKFDFQQVSARLPKVDLPDLRPFVETALVLNNRRVDVDDERSISFMTPSAWREGEPAIVAKYEGMIFDRKDRSENSSRRLMGVGHRLVNKALDQARKLSVSNVTLPSELLEYPIIVFRVQDRVTVPARKPDIIVGVEVREQMDNANILLDWQLLLLLNKLPLRKRFMKDPSPAPTDLKSVRSSLDTARGILKQQLGKLDHGFRVPDSEILAILWPIPASLQEDGN